MLIYYINTILMLVFIFLIVKVWRYIHPKPKPEDKPDGLDMLNDEIKEKMKHPPVDVFGQYMFEAPKRKKYIEAFGDKYELVYNKDYAEYTKYATLKYSRSL